MGDIGFEIWEDNASASCTKKFVNAVMQGNGKGNDRRAFHAIGASRKAKLDAWKQRKSSGTKSSVRPRQGSQHNNAENISPASSLDNRSSSNVQQSKVDHATTSGSVVPNIASLRNDGLVLPCSIYTREKSAVKWRKRGSGKGRVSFVPSLQNVTSVQVRSSVTQRLLANFSVSANVQLCAQSSRSWMLSADDFSTDCKAVRTHFMLRFSSTEDAQKFQTGFLAAQESNKSEPSTNNDSSPPAKATPVEPQKKPEVDGKCRLSATEQRIQRMQNEINVLTEKLKQEKEARKRDAEVHAKLLNRFQGLLDEAKQAQNAHMPTVI